MTANDLVNTLESNRIKLFGQKYEDAGRAIILYTQTADMLRQQAQEISNLKIANQALLQWSDPSATVLMEGKAPTAPPIKKSE
jgi:hypothetical protein